MRIADCGSGNESLEPSIPRSAIRMFTCSSNELSNLPVYGVEEGSYLQPTVLTESDPPIACPPKLFPVREAEVSPR